MRRLLLAGFVLALIAFALPPLYFHYRPDGEPAQLPPIGMRIAVGSGSAVNAIAMGEGPTLVLIHGLPGCGYDWSTLAAALSVRGFRTLAYDRIGYGYSDGRSDGDYTIAANARELLALLASQDLHDVTLVGWSYGAPVAIEAAGRDGSRIARLVLIGGAGPLESMGARPPALVSKLIFSPPMLAWLRAVPPAGRAVQRAMSREAFSGEPPAWWLSQLSANLGSPHSLETFAGENARFEDGDAAVDPVALAQPILLFHGDDDRLVPLSSARWIESHARHAELVVVEGGSHMLPITHAALLADRIASFATTQRSDGQPPLPAPST
jgi:pimeloyl-ACP methyl ester carboxylesterase